MKVHKDGLFTLTFLKYFLFIKNYIVSHCDNNINNNNTSPKPI